MPSAPTRRTVWLKRSVKYKSPLPANAMLVGHPNFAWFAIGPVP
jgi:hypothetical protein